jgi:hypothetical protein
MSKKHASQDCVEVGKITIESIPGSPEMIRIAYCYDLHENCLSFDSRELSDLEDAIAAWRRAKGSR